jgi:hypothetical protein
MRLQSWLLVVVLGCTISAQGSRSPVELANAPVPPGARRIPVITDLIGGSPEERPERYHDGSPIELLPLGVPQVFFAGQMFAAHVEPYESAAKRAGDPVQTSAHPKAGHFVFIDPQSEVWPQVMRSVRRLLGEGPA